MQDSVGSNCVLRDIRVELQWVSPDVVGIGGCNPAWCVLTASADVSAPNSEVVLKSTIMPLWSPGTLSHERLITISIDEWEESS